MLAYSLAIAAVVILALQLYAGIAVVGFPGSHWYIERSKNAGPYWFMMALEAVAGLLISAKAYALGL